MKHHSMKHEGHGIYKHEVEMPHMPEQGHMIKGRMGEHDFKGEAMNIAYGQSGEQGCRADEKRMSAQFKDYHWDGEHGATGY